MRKKMYIFLFMLLILSTDIAFGNAGNKTKINKQTQNRHIAKIHDKSERPKRALQEEQDFPFWSNRGKKELDSDNDPEKDPFWATRGRRESAENEVDFDKSLTQNGRLCDDCYPAGNHDAVFGNVKHAREDVSPFWGNRGRRDSDEMDDDFFWGSRGRRQENDPFWGTRGRREEHSPFWSNRGRREENPFWGNRGRREENPFWGNRGRRENEEPFWGNRGRREEPEPFWGNRGRREEPEPFWGNRGRRKEGEPFWSSRGRRKQDLKESILNAINVVEEDIENLSRLRRSNEDQGESWSTKSRGSRLPHLRTRLRQYQNYLRTGGFKSDPGTVLDNTMYAEQPDYILVERNSRSSAEDDPFYITRGKKYFLNVDFEKAARDRRGAIEEIVKSVRNDPYYIARGKKNMDVVKIGNSTLSREEFLKARELICATVDLVMLKDGKNKQKRDVDSERDRRATLKKLAAQLQIDPYFVSRGKKSDLGTSGKETITLEDSLEDFINEVASKCN